jgi:hypothetical protein
VAPLLPAQAATSRDEKRADRKNRKSKAGDVSPGFSLN